ncbi:transcriptional regulator [Legionella beliardensis]|uniref:Transcriptional regulator n=1 Tax=Legionella beliardensis TaxID=91822 RepID=A0A378IB79_9GAMM|nr:LysR family transcriptional regulator [Legionella beliardensis]STX29564.1 transcriptional regulator [Legionella beliardensis]
MNTLGLIQTFCKVAQHCNFTAAAHMLNISAAAVSKQISLLEKELGVALFERTTRRVTLTAIGELYYQEIQKVLLSLEQATNLVAKTKTEPAGVIRVKSARFFAEKIILPRMICFQKRYPQITLDLQIAEQVPHLPAEELDVVFGMSMAVASNSIQKKIGTTRYIFCASPAYLKQAGVPREPADLAHHAYITHSMRKPNDSWTFTNGETVSLKPTLYLNDATAMVDCACRGLGIVVLHSYQVADALKTGELIEILTDYQMPAIPVFIFYHPARFMQPKVKVWVEAMTDNISF